MGRTAAGHVCRYEEKLTLWVKFDSIKILQKLALDSGAITQHEYDAERRKILEGEQGR